MSPETLPKIMPTAAEIEARLRLQIDEINSRESQGSTSSNDDVEAQLRSQIRERAQLDNILDSSPDFAPREQENGLSLEVNFAAASKIAYEGIPRFESGVTYPLIAIRKKLYDQGLDVDSVVSKTVDPKISYLINAKLPATFQNILNKLNPKNAQNLLEASSSLATQESLLDKQKKLGNTSLLTPIINGVKGFPKGVAASFKFADKLIRNPKQTIADVSAVGKNITNSLVTGKKIRVSIS